MAGEQGERGLGARSVAGPGAARQPETAPARPAVSPTYGRPRSGEPERPPLLRGAVPLRTPASDRPASVPPAGPARPAPSRPAAARVPVERAVERSAPAPRRRAQPEPAPRRRPDEKVAVPDADVAYVSVVEASRETGASPSAVRGWARDGQVRSRRGTGPRGERTEVALVDVERLTVEQPPAAAPARAGEPVQPGRARPRAKRERPSTEVALRNEPEVSPGAQLVPMTTVDAMERLSGELYLSGQRAARAEAVAELRDRRLADLQQEVDELRLRATGLWEQNQELLRRVAVAEAQVVAVQQAQAQQAAAAPAGQAGAESPWRRLRR